MRLRRFRRQRRTLLWTALIAGILATGAYAYTNTINGLNSTPPVGSSANVIGAYTASNISFTLDTTNPANIHFVNFTLSPVTASTFVKVQLVAGGAWYPAAGGCTVTVGTGAVQCDVSGATAASAMQLTIVAAN